MKEGKKRERNFIALRGQFVKIIEKCLKGTNFCVMCQLGVRK